MNAAGDIARSQFRVFASAGDAIALPAETRRRVLLLSQDEWSAWSRVASGGGVPDRPALPVMLRRLGSASYRLHRLAERRGA